MNYPYKKGCWETKDHQKIKISDMKTSHLKNTINYLKRHQDFYEEDYGRGYDDDYDYEDNSELVYKKISELEEELNKRSDKNGFMD